MMPIRSAADFDAVLSTMARERADGFLVPSSPGEHVQAGGLMSYGADFNDMYRKAALYVDKILRGEKPADLSVEQASKYELVINLRAAKMLGIDLPPALLTLRRRADRVTASRQFRFESIASLQRCPRDVR